MSSSNVGNPAATTTSTSSVAVNNNAANNNNTKKDEFKNYLDKAGVLDALTKVLVGLYEEPERPSAPLEYVKKHLGCPEGIDSEGYRRENEELKKEVERLRRQLAAASGSGMSSSAASASKAMAKASGAGDKGAAASAMSS